MKKQIILWMLALVSVGTYSQTGIENYVTETIPLTEAKTINDIQNQPKEEKVKVTEYYDGLGRMSQTVAGEASPLGLDIVQFEVYDHLGRTPKSYSGYSYNNQNANDYVSNAVGKQADFYKYEKEIANTDYPYSERKFEQSPLNFMVESSAPGQSWQMSSGHTVKQNYRTNTPADNIFIWEITSTDCQTNGTYPAAELSVMQQTDENGHYFLVYYDKRGLPIVRERRNDAATAQSRTYYIYDDFFRLRYIVSPLAMEKLAVSRQLKLSSLTEDLLTQYEYDAKGRVLLKDLPDKAPERFVYDNQDRLILRQDGNMAAENKWYFYKYDGYGTIIMEGIVDYPEGNANDYYHSRQNLQNYLDAAYLNKTFDNHEERYYYHIPASSIDEAKETEIEARYTDYHGYTNNAFPSIEKAAVHGVGGEPRFDEENIEVLKVFYFDNYDLRGDGYPDQYLADHPFGNEPQRLYAYKRGLPTAAKIRILNTPHITSIEAWTYTTYFYGDRDLPYCIAYQNQFGNTSKTYFKFDFAGKLLETWHYHHGKDNYNLKIHNWFTYDKPGRLLKLEQQLGGDPKVTIAGYRYNELGQLVEKNLHSKDGISFLQQVNFGYNERGWLKNINDCNLEALSPLLNSIVDENDPAGEEGHKQWQLSESGAAYVQDIVSNTANNAPEAAANEENFLAALQQRPLEEICNRSFIRLFNPDETTLTAINDGSFEITMDVIYEWLGAKLYNNYNELETDAKEIMQAELVLRYVPISYDAYQLLEKQFMHQLFTVFGDRLHQKKLYGQRQYYDEELDITNLGGPAQYNGNISATCWNSSGTANSAYGYQYDYQNRLTKATYGQYDNSVLDYSKDLGRYDVYNISYDANGNLKTIDRNGLSGTSGAAKLPVFGKMDEMTYAYSGNRLLDVTENIAHTGGKDYHPTAPITGNAYAYDLNGNMTADKNKGHEIAYNHMNLPNWVKPDYTGAGSNKGIHFLYDANGQLLHKKVVTPDGSTANTWYCEGMVYNDGGLELISHAEGRIVPDQQNGHNYRYEYHYRDHLGNLRLRFSDLDDNGRITTKEVLQEAHYYPFGMQLGGLQTHITGAKHKFTYNGKELHEEYDLNWLGYGFRYYNPALARWMVPDPLQEYYHYESPYTYVSNNPVRNIDPFGLNVEDTQGEDEKSGKKKKKNKKANKEKEKTEKRRSHNGLGKVKVTVTPPEEKEKEEEKKEEDEKTETEVAEEKNENEEELEFDSDENIVEYIVSEDFDFSESNSSFEVDDGFDWDGAVQTADDLMIISMAVDGPFLFYGDAAGLTFLVSTRLGRWISRILKGRRLLSSAKGASGSFQVGKYTITKTVANNLATRPYINSPLTITNIMKSGKGVPDEFFKGGVNYKVPGAFNGSKGIFELGINPETNTIYHFLFKSVK